MKKKQVRITVLFLFALLIAGAAYNYLFYSEHRNIAKEDVSATLSANEIHKQFLTNESLATSNYLDRVLETTGKITAVEEHGVILSNRLQVMFNSEEVLKFQNGEALTVKGRCVGYDELLEMVKIDQAVIIHKEN